MGVAHEKQPHVSSVVRATAATLAALEGHGLIRRTPDPGDGRRRLVTLTEAGRTRIEGGRTRIEGGRQVREEWPAHALQERCVEEERATVLQAPALLERLTWP
ncbi:winged helix DNA-binding protein [Streptomyces echinoruber]|uniref:winged helix DNA-binding protein n=1 Tax=Streptomyces echinoruber TaxID=68898 RepID=UPI0027E57C15|nr:winged helix DNA-binding protein [Streptomyces echinoruber]